MMGRLHLPSMSLSLCVLVTCCVAAVVPSTSHNSILSSESDSVGGENSHIMIPPATLGSEGRSPRYNINQTETDSNSRLPPAAVSAVGQQSPPSKPIPAPVYRAPTVQDLPSSSQPAITSRPPSPPPTSPILCERPDFPHLGFMFRPPKKFFNVTEYAIITCALNNKVRSTLICSEDGTFKPRSTMFYPDCEEPLGECETLDPVQNGYYLVHRHQLARKGLMYPIHTTLNFHCSEGFRLVGVPTIVCEKMYKWTAAAPTCVRSEGTPSSGSKTSTKVVVLMTLVGIVGVLCLVVSSYVFYRWRQQKLQRLQWQRYFGNYTYRQSKTNINPALRRPPNGGAGGGGGGGGGHNGGVMNNLTPQEMHQFKDNRESVPVTDL